jgi:hypothetical protein
MIIEDISFLTDMALGVILLIIIIFLFLKDGESNRKLKRYEKSIEDLHYEIFQLKKELQEFKESSSQAIADNKPVDDYEIYKKLIKFLEKDNVDYVTVSKNNEMSVSIPVSELSEEIRYIIKPNPIADMFRQSAS